MVVPALVAGAQCHVAGGHYDFSGAARAKLRACHGGLEFPFDVVSQRDGAAVIAGSDSTQAEADAAVDIQIVIAGKQTQSCQLPCKLPFTMTSLFDCEVLWIRHVHRGGGAGCSGKVAGETA